MTWAQAKSFSSPAPLEWGVRLRAYNGATDCGDCFVVHPYSCGMLVGVIDGLGHGEEAAVAAQTAAQALADNAERSASELMLYCHEAMHKTRGAVVSLALFSVESATMTWLGVGNVEGILFRANAQTPKTKEALLLRGGVVGYQMPPLHPTTLPIFPGDTLVFVTDGVRSAFSQQSPLGASPDMAAADILDRYGKDTDDALVLVARYLGGSV